MEENNQNFIAPPTPAKPKKSPLGIIIVLIFLVVLGLTFLSTSLALSNALFWAMIIMGFLTAAQVFTLVTDSVKDRGPASKTFAAAIGIVAALVIVFISFIAGISGTIRNSPPMLGD